MAKHCERNWDKVSKNCTQSDLNNLREETESALTAAQDHGSQIEKYQFHKHYYFGGSEFERMTYEHAMLMTDLTLEEFYIMHVRFEPVPVFTARFTESTSVTTILSYPLHTDFMYEYEENFTESLTTTPDRIFNNSYPSDFEMESKCLTAAGNGGTYTEKNQFHKQYYFRESGPAFKRMSHNVSWNEFRMHVLCLERKPVPIFTASYTQNYTLCTHYCADMLQPECECYTIPLSTDDPLHAYFMFEYEEIMITIPVSDRNVTESDAHVYFMSKDNETITNYNSTLSHCTSGESNKKVDAKDSSKNSSTNNSEESFLDDETLIAQHELTNNRTLAYLDDSTRIYARMGHHSSGNSCQDNETSVTLTTVTLSDNSASKSTFTSEENEGIVAKVSSKNSCSESDDKTQSWCVPTSSTFSDRSMDTNRMSALWDAHAFANSSTFSNNTIRAGSSSSSSGSGSPAYTAGAGVIVPFLDSDVAISIIKIIIIVIIALLLLLLIVYLIKKCFGQPKPKRQDPKNKCLYLQLTYK